MKTPVITFVAYDWPDNVCGPATWLQRLLPKLTHHGLGVRCLVLCWDKPGPFVEFLNRTGIPFTSIACQDTTEQRVRWILDQLIEEPPDVFVPNLVVPAMYAARWAREAGIPTVGILHSDDEFYHGVLNVFANGRACDAFTSLVCVSRSLEQQCMKSRPSKTQIVRIPYGVDVPSTPTDRTPAPLKLVYVGRLSEEQKRISDVTRGLCRAVSEIPGVEADIIGEGPDSDNVQDIIAAVSPQLPIRLLGRLEAEEVIQRLSNYDAIVLLSDYEGLPVALLEAMAYGVIPICSPMRSGIDELVDHEVTGLIVSDREDSFVDAVRTLHRDRVLRTRLAQAAQLRVKREFSHEASSNQWAKFLQSLAQASNSSTAISEPENLDLPPIHPALAAEDYRSTEPTSRSLFDRFRGIASRVGILSPPSPTGTEN